MNRETDPLAESFAHLRRTTLDSALAARVHARARAELVPIVRPASPSARLRAAVAASLVPTLLLAAAAAQFVETAQIAAAIYTSPVER